MEHCPWCLGENNEQHALRALGAVLGDLADLGFDAEWTGIRASDIGAPHGRFRIFILAWPVENTSRRGSSGGASRQEPTRRNDEAFGSDQGSDGGRADTSVTLLPTPNTMEMLPVREGEARERARFRGDLNGSRREKAGNLRERVVEDIESGVITLLPTPVAQPSGNSPEEHLRKSRVEWGPYEPAIRRWETILGRPAPDPVTHDGRNGKARLNPALTEFMMGWPAGHVTDPAIGLSRAEQLKACGNGVVPAQAAAALREMLARPGVPEVAA